MAYLLLLTLLSLALTQPSSDSCVSLLRDIFGKEHCDWWYRDTIINFFRAAGLDAPFANQNLNTSCTCGPTAFFVNFLHSGVTRMLDTWKEQFTNSTIRTYLQYTKVIGSNQDNYPSVRLPNGRVRCNRLSNSAAELDNVMLNLRCELGLPPCHATGPGADQVHKVIQVAVNWDEVMDGLDHTFSLSRAGPDEFYLWQGYVANYDLYHWINQIPTARWNIPGFVWGPPAKFHGRLAALQMVDFLNTLESLVVGKQTVADGLKIWQELFWIPIPDPLPLPFNCNITKASRVPCAIAAWSQPYNPDSCKENFEAMIAVAWSKEHEAERREICKKNDKPINCFY